MFHNLMNHLHRWLAQRRADEFRLWLETYQQAIAWQRTAPCPACQSPQAQDARFCSNCGAPLLVEEPGQGSGPYTAPIAIPELPIGQNLLHYLEQHKQPTGPITIAHRALRKGEWR